MGVDSSAVGNFAAPHKIEHEGVTYTISLIDQNAKAEWERRLFARAVQVADIIATSKGEAWKEGKLVELNDEFMGGEFALLGEKSLKLLQTPGGIQLIMSILTGRDILELAPLVMERNKELQAMLHLVIRESFPGLKIPPPSTNGDSSPN